MKRKNKVVHESDEPDSDNDGFQKKIKNSWKYNIDTETISIGLVTLNVEVPICVDKIESELAADKESFTLDEFGAKYRKYFVNATKFIVENAIELYFLLCWLLEKEEAASSSTNNILVDIIAGFGKSIVIELLKTRFNVLSCGSTNVSARLIGGKTLHSIFMINWKTNAFGRETIKADVLICDEISMVPVPIFLKVLEVTKKQCKKSVLIGDLTQLPPTKSKLISPNNTDCDVYITMAPEMVSIPRFKNTELCGLVLNFRKLVLHENDNVLTKEAYTRIFSDMAKTIKKIMEKNTVSHAEFLEYIENKYDNLAKLIQQQQSAIANNTSSIDKIIAEVEDIGQFVNIVNVSGKTALKLYRNKLDSNKNNLIKYGVIFSSRIVEPEDFNYLDSMNTLNHKDLNCTVGSLITMRESDQKNKLVNGDLLLITSVENIQEDCFKKIRSVASGKIYSIYFQPPDALPQVRALVVDKDSPMFKQTVLLTPKLVKSGTNNNIHVFTFTNAIYCTIHRLQGKTILPGKKIFVNLEICKSFLLKPVFKKNKLQIPHLRYLYVIWSRLTNFDGIVFF